MTAAEITLSVQVPGGRLVANRVYTITYTCRNIGYGVEEGCIEGFWTGETDTWGKRTIRDINGGPTIYLFRDEITGLEEPSQ